MFDSINERINESDALPILSSVANSKEGMTQKSPLTQYSFVNHFKSTTPCLPIYFPIFNTNTP